ncbi:MAG TPA: ABC transporter substrate-binding protein [Candidatus Limnocylindrales bacterium]|nr:ABC transporter substrate-binding protein [Candidatus Limnocylindrales bacterium]
MTRLTNGRTLAMAIAAALVVAACGGGAATPAPASDTPASSAPAESAAAGAVPGPLDEAVTVRFGIFPNITHAPGLVALADGGQLGKLLPNATINVKSFNSGTTAVEAMFSDAIDITFIGPNPAINAYSKSDGEAVRIIAGSTSGGAFLVVRPEIKTAADLKGKKIATPSLGNTQDVALRAWLKAQGFATDTAGGGDVSVVPQENAQTLETFIDGTIDGAWVPEPWATRLIKEGGAVVLVDERDLWPDGKYVTTHLMVATPFLEKNPEVVKRILLATIQAVDFVNENQAEAQAIVNAEIEKWTTKKLGEELLKTAWGNLSFTVDPIASSLGKSASDAQSLELLKDPGDLKGLYDLTLLNEILKGLGEPEASGL